MTARVPASSTKKSAVGGVQAIHAMLSIAPSSNPAERETARDVIAAKPDHQHARNDGQDAGSSPKNRCLSPRKRYRENAFAAGSATAIEMMVLSTTYFSELM